MLRQFLQRKTARFASWWNAPATRKGLLLNLYTLDGKLYSPVCARTKDGFYLEQKPVDFTELNNEPVAARLIEAKIATGNPIIPTPNLRRNPIEPAIKGVDGLSLSRFNQSAKLWLLKSIEGGFDLLETSSIKGGGWQSGKSVLSIPSNSAGVVANAVAKKLRELG